MNINFEGIKGRISAYYEIARQYSTLWGHDVLKISNKTLDHIQKDPYSAAAVLFASNMIFFEIARQISIVVDKIFNRFFVRDKDLEKNLLFTKSITVLTLLTVLIAAMNVGLIKVLKLPLSPFKVTAISVASCLSYFLFRHHLANRVD